MRAPAQELAHSLLDACLERRRFGLLYDFAQPYSITLICRLLGVPTDRHRDLLDWSHRRVKMHEFDTTEEQAQSAARAAAEFRAYVLELIEERRSLPRDDMVSALVGARVDGGALSADEIVSTVVVLPQRGSRSDCEHTRQRRPRAAPPPRAVAASRRRRSAGSRRRRRADPLRPPLQLFERWVLDSAWPTVIPASSRIRTSSTSAARMPQSTSVLAAASTSASAHRSRASNSRRACTRSSCGRQSWSWP